MKLSESRPVNVEAVARHDVENQIPRPLIKMASVVSKPANGGGDRQQEHRGQYPKRNPDRLPPEPRGKDGAPGDVSEPRRGQAVEKPVLEVDTGRNASSHAGQTTAGLVSGQPPQLRGAARIGDRLARVAQLAEQGTLNPKVHGSIPCAGTRYGTCTRWPLLHTGPVTRPVEGALDFDNKDLRHTTATTLLEAGVHPKVVQDLLGPRRHSTFTQSASYRDYWLARA